MNELKYQITQIIFLILLGLGGYWALTSLDNGMRYTRDQIVEDYQQQEIPDEKVNAVNNEAIINPNEESPTEIVDEPKEEVVKSVDSETEELINALQKLVDDKVTMNSGATGSRVGTVQKFLDVYFENKEVSIDNDFGPTTKGLVKDFQQAELSGGDGRIGPNTLRAMIQYLEK